jgi:hypothetical protein
MSATCDAAGTNDGTCFPELNASNAVAFGICFQDGTAAVGATCDPNSTRASDPTGACVAGAICNSNVCLQICNPDGGSSSCASGTTCTASGYPDVGECQ